MNLSHAMSRLVKFVPVVMVLAAAGCADFMAEDLGPRVITVNDDYYQPAELTVVPGRTVSWEWAGGNEHSVTFDAPTAPDEYNSPVQREGTHDRLFMELGTYDYHCEVHPNMVGRIMVEPPNTGVTF